MPENTPATAAPAPLPHDRDESASPPVENAQHRANRAPIRQAHDDVESGVQDTERIGTPGDVPSSRQNGRKSGWRPAG